jgi:hypothetical protein
MDELLSLSGDTIERLASILSHIVVYFDCDNALEPKSAVDIQYYFQNSENLKFTLPLFSDINVIRKAIMNKFGRTELTKYYNIQFPNFRRVDDLIVTPGYTSSSGFRLRFPCSGVSEANLVREFKGIKSAVSVQYSASQRVAAICQHIQSAMTIGGTLKTSSASTSTPRIDSFEDIFTSATRSASTPTDLIDYDHFRLYSVNEQVIVICKLFETAQLSAKEKVVEQLIDGQVSNSFIMLHVKQEIAKQMIALKRQMKEEGLDKTSTYCKAAYKKPVGVVTEQITRVKSYCPMLFSILLKTVCADSFNANYNAAINQKSTMEVLLTRNRVNKKITSQEELVKHCFGNSNRRPNALTIILNNVQGVSTSPISTPTLSLPYSPELMLSNTGNTDERLVIASIEYIQKVALKFIDELTRKEALAMSVCEILLQMRDSGHGLTPTGVQMGLLSNLCGFTNQGQDLFSAKM